MTSTQDTLAGVQPQGREPNNVKVSGSVEGVYRELSNNSVRATTLLASLCKSHPDYIDKLAGKIAEALAAGDDDLPAGDPPEQKSPSEWANEAMALFSILPDGVLDTRHLMLGLALLDSVAFAMFWQHRAFSSLFAEIAGSKGVPISPQPARPPEGEGVRKQKRSRRIFKPKSKPVKPKKKK